MGDEGGFGTAELKPDSRSTFKIFQNTHMH